MIHRVRNIYHMLSYAFQVLRQEDFARCGVEDFANAADLMAAILDIGVSRQIRLGLRHAYIEHTDELAAPRGRICVSDSVRRQTMARQRLVCTHDDYSVNAYMNCVLKTTMLLLVRYGLPAARTQRLRQLLRYFKDVDTIDHTAVNWHLALDRSCQAYMTLMAVCRMVIDGLLQTTGDGRLRMHRFLDEQRMSRLYEKFILEYFKRHYPQLSPSASHIAWALDNGFSDMLPQMRSDVTLSHGGKTLIVDAKYYSRVLQSWHGTGAATFHSANLYQIFTYVKNMAARHGGEVSGMLLYAATDEDSGEFSATYSMSGNTISVATLDLNRDFGAIAGRLNQIAERMLG